LQNDIFKEDLNPLKEAILTSGAIFKEEPYVPFEHPDDAGRRLNQICWDGSKVPPCVVFHGSIPFAQQIVRNVPVVPGAYYNSKNLECTSYYPYFSKYLLNVPYAMLPVGALLEDNPQRRFVFDTFGYADTIFLRPNKGNKVFAGLTVSQDEITRELHYSITRSGVSTDELVLVSRPRRVSKEWRFVIADRQVITGSQYMVDGHLEVSEDIGHVGELLQSMINNTQWEPERVYVVDVCECNGEKYIVELNSFSCSGLYACDKSKIVNAVNKAALADWKEVWIPPLIYK
jgi:hypothetical protein